MRNAIQRASVGALGTWVTLAAISALSVVGASSGHAEDCKCSNMEASSTPAVANDVCTMTATSSSCSLKWNAKSTGSSSSNNSSSSSTNAGSGGSGTADAQFHAAFLGFVNSVERSMSVKPDPFWAQMSPRDINERWLNLLRFGEYRKEPHAVAAGFLGLVFAALTVRNEGAQEFAQTFGQSSSVLGDVANPLSAAAGEASRTIQRGSRQLVVGPGCLRYEGGLRNTRHVVVENDQARASRRCR